MEAEGLNKLADYPFEKWDFGHYFKTLYKDRGFKAFYQFFNRPHRRPFSRSLIQKFAPNGIGLEIGCGARTICPTDRTILSDAYSEHGIHDSIAKVLFRGDQIPYEDLSFDFIVSEHVLEHIANPIKALKEWVRALKKEGHLFLFLPHCERTNDCFREVTTLEHLKSDYEQDVPFNDETHFEDWFSNVVEKGLMPDHYRHLSKEELLNSASIHFHVWNPEKIVELLQYLGLDIVFVDDRVHDRRDTFAVIAQKVSLT